MQKNQKGFGLIEIVVAVAVIGLVVAVIAVGMSALGGKKSNPFDMSPDNSGGKNNRATKWSETPQGPYHDKISYATSTDLLHWTDSGKILAEHTSVPDVMIKNGVIYMYFVDVNTDDKAEQIGLKTSSDKGATWSDTTIITINGVGDKVPVDPDPFLLSDGRIRLYYFDIADSGTKENPKSHKIYSAISRDGKTFQQEDGVRFEHQNILDPDVTKVGNTWRMYVGANMDVLSATSKDGLSFKYEGVASAGKGSVPNIYFDGNRYLLFTAGVSISSSSDGKTFTSLDRSQTKAVQGADPGVVKLGDNNYLMTYKINSHSGQPNPGGGQPQPPAHQ